VASRGGGGSGSGDGVADILRSIRRQIEQAKTYPDAARRAGMEGTVELRFQIGRGGNAEGLEIVRSSGHPELDEAAMQTIRRAGPYPAYTARIRIPLSYRLDR
jgi:periplasmic protein TonB